MEEGMLWQCLGVGFALGSSPGRLWLGSLVADPALVPGREWGCLVWGGFEAWLVASARFCCCLPAGVVTLPCRVPNLST